MAAALSLYCDLCYSQVLAGSPSPVPAALVVAVAVISVIVVEVLML